MSSTQPRPQRRLGDEDYIVDDLALDEGDDRLAYAAEDSGSQGNVDVAAVPEHVAPQPPYPPEAGLVLVDVVCLGRHLTPSAKLSAAICSMASPMETRACSVCPGSGVLAQTSTSHASHGGLYVAQPALALGRDLESRRPLVALHP